MISLYRFVLPVCLTLLLTAQAAQAQNPNPAINVTVTSGNESVTLTWEPPTEGPTVTGYTPNCKDGIGNEYTPVRLGGSARSYTFTGCPYSMVNGTTYSFSVTTHTDMRSNLPNTETIVSTKAGLPAAPTGLTATAGDHQVALSWTAGSNNGSALTKYEYQQNGGSWANMANSDASTTSHAVTGLTNGTQYTFKVRAVNTHGGGGEATVTATPVGPPEKPTGLTATDSDQQVALSWTAPSNTGGAAITSYKYSKDNGTTWTTIQGSGSSTTSHTVTGLTNGTEYTFKVQAVNTHGDGAESAAAKATPATKPAAPTNLSATDNAQASGAVKLTWTAPTNTGGAAITGYKYSKDDGSSWTATGATSTNHTVTNLTNGTAYKFKVRAVNRKGDGTASAVATATPSTTPLAPGSLSAALPSGEAKKVKLTWTTPNNRGAAIESYNYRQNGGGWTNIPNSGASTTSYTVENLTNGTQYSFEVRAKNRKGNSAIAGPVTTTTPNVPAAPTNLTATDSDQQVALSWTAPTNNGGLAITRYEYSKDNGSSWTSTGTNTSRTVTGLTNGTEYTFQVRAVNAAGNGAVATKKATPSTKPDAPTLTTPFIEGNKQVRLRWPAPNNGGSDITDYYYQQDGGSWTSTGSTDTSYLVTGLTNGMTYTFKVRAKNRKGEGAASDSATATPRNFTATAGNQSVALDWSALPDNANIAKWEYQHNGAWMDIQGSDKDTRSYTVTGLENGTEYTFQVRALNSGNTPVEHIEFPSATPRSVSTTTGGGGGGGATATTDQHGDTAATATAIAADSSTPGEINARDDQDYFTISVPQAGWLVVETTGSVDTRGKLTTSNGTVLAEAASGGAGRNFQVTHRVPPGTYLVVVTGTGTGSYRLEVDLFVGHLENPRPDSPQSGLGVLSGWLCAVDSVVFEIEDDPDQESWAAATGTLRPDTASECHGKAETGFGLLYNWNRLEDGDHPVRLVLNGIPVETRTVTVTTLGEEVLRGATGETTLTDFPTAGDTVGLVWQEAQQNFRLAPPGSLSQPPAPLLPLPAPLIGRWETPSPDSFQSGLSVLSGWVCEADSIVFEIDHDPDQESWAAATGTLRPDTAPHCEGQTETGFGLLYNWNRVGDGDHTVRLVVDGMVVDTRTVTVTTLGKEVMWGLTRTAEVADFPSPGQVVTVEWQEAKQNFVITGIGE